MKNFLLDLIFPRFCLGCKKELNLKQASFICEACFNNIALNGIECHVCGLRNNAGTCRNCRKKMSLRDIFRRETFLNGLFAAGKYQDPILREAIHQFKYQSIESLKKPLAELVIKYLKKENLIGKFQNRHSMFYLETPFPIVILTPIPLTWRRKLSRGFNQSELLAKELSLVLNCPVVNLLKRQKFSAPQAKIKDWNQRKENISGVFCLNPKFFNYPHLIPPPIKGEARPTLRGGKTIDVGHQYKRVILVDDVSTSGATLEEAAKVLKEAGIKEVYGLVVAKG